MHILIFSGYNQRAVIAFLRTLTQNEIVNYSIVARDCEDTIFNTIYKDKVFCTRQEKDIEINYLLELLNSIKKKYFCKSIFLAPTTEYLNRFFLDYRETIEKVGGIIPLTDIETYIKISDKETFQDICKNRGLDTPTKINLPIKYESPFVAKPKKYCSESGEIYSPILIKSETEFQRFISNYEIRDFYFQEYIYGKSYYLLYYFSKTGECYCYSQENILQQPYGKSIVAAKYSDVHMCNINQQYKKLFEELNFTGLVMVEFREKEDKKYMIEANPRFWGPSQFFVDSEYNFFEFLLRDYGFVLSQKKERNDYAEVKYFWRGGIYVYPDAELEEYGQFVFDEYNAFDIYNREDTKVIYEQECKRNERKIDPFI